MTLIKYPRTPHLPYSEGVGSDDKILEDDSIFIDKEVVVTTKMDGENTTIYSTGFSHARSLNSIHRSYHSWLLSYVPTISYKIPNGYRLCGEYLYAQHSIKYNDLNSYFLAFSLWNDNNICVSWQEFEEFCLKNNIFCVPILYKGKYNANIIENIAKNAIINGQEGIVVRNIDAFHYTDFNKNVAKYVRKNHVQTDEHWSLSTITTNSLKREI